MDSEGTQLRALLDLQRDLALEADVDKVLGRIAAAATELLGAERATLYVVDDVRQELWSRAVTESELKELRLPLDGRSLAAEVARTGKILRITDPYGDPRFDASVDARTGFRTRSLMVLPINSRAHERLGVLQAVNQRDGTFEPHHEAVGVALAQSAGIVLEYLRLSDELARERLRQVHIAEETRHRLARDLHDGVAQTLANTALGIEIAQKRAESDVPGALADLGTLRERLVEAQKGLRDILFALRPTVLEQEGLCAAVTALAQRVDGTTGTKVAARQMDLARRLGTEVEAALFHVIREAVNNAIKNGRARSVSIDVRDESGTVSAVVEDDGPGFDVASTLAGYASRGSLGLLQMRESARQIGGRLVIDSSPGHGTRVRIQVPAATR